MPLPAGSRLGAYEVLAPLGQGGMGEVYRARDTTLGRDVAIKILSTSFSADTDRLKRFEQEARTAGALNHPNLVTIFEFGVTPSTSSGQAAPYIVMELVEGETLRQRLTTGTTASHALPVRKGIDFAMQIAHGLAAAHERGIVHRDLKPENIIVTPDGRLKILDFGLAKAMDPNVGRGFSRADPGAPKGTPYVPSESPTMASPAITSAGSVMGTVGYMAPEQVRGEAAIDHRADLFALGAILYEMLSGRRAFHAGSAVETMNAILREEPPDLVRETTEIPPALARVVQRCLEKSPAERFQSARDLGFHLSAISGDSGHQSGAVPAMTAAPERRRGVFVIGAVGLAGVLAGLALGWSLLRQPTIEPVRFETFTYSGSDSSPSASPDGKTIAFSSARNGKRQIWLKQIDGGGETARTLGPDDRNPSFSPDGASLLFLRSENGRVDLFRTAVLGGEDRRVMEDVRTADWSPDGTSIAFGRMSSDGRGMVGVVQVDGSNPRELHAMPEWLPAGVSWSPDGRVLLAFFTPRIGTTGAQLKLIPVDGGDPRTLQNPAAASTGSTPVWTDSGEIVYAASSEISRVLRLAERGHRIVAHNPETDRVRTLFWTFAAPEVMDVLAEGTLVFDGISFSQNLRAVPLGSGGSGQAAPTWLTRGSSMDRQPSFSPDGEWVIFASNRSRNLDLWSLSRRDGSIRRLTDDASADWDPAYTPDGKSIIWSSNRSGHFEIWIAATDGSGARQLSQDGFDAENPTMTPDGKWVLHWSANPEKRGIWKMRPDGTDATHLVKGSFSAPEVSPDGLYFAVPAAVDGERRRVFVYRVDDGAAVPFSVLIARNGSNDPNFGRLRWMPDGKAIAFVAAGTDGVTGIFVQDFVPGQDTSATRRKLAGFSTEVQAESFSFAPDGSVIVISVAATTSDVALARGIPGLLPPNRGKR